MKAPKKPAVCAKICKAKCTKLVLVCKVVKKSLPKFCPSMMCKKSRKGPFDLGTFLDKARGASMKRKADKKRDAHPPASMLPELKLLE